MATPSTFAPPHESHDNPDVLQDAYSLKIKKTWQRLREEPWYFWAFCGYILFEYVRPQTIYPILNILPWGLVTLFGAFFLRALSTEPKGISSPLTLPFLSFFFFAFLSACFSYYPAEAFKHYDILINWPLVLVLFIWIVTTRFRFYIVTLLFLLCSFKMAQHAAASWVLRGFSFSGWGVSGAPGFFTNAADLGVQLVIFLPMAAVFWYSFKRYWGRGWRLFIFLFPLAALAGAIGTGQRNTMLALVALGLGVILLFKHRLRNIFLVAIVAGLVWLAMPQEFKARFETAGEDNTSLSRLHYWGRGMEMYREHPWLGVGYQNWVPYYTTRYPGEQRSQWVTEVAHSTPVTLLAELGTLGTLCYYWLVLGIFFTNIKTSRLLAHLEPPFWRLFPIALNLGLLGFLAASIFLSITYYPFLFFHAGFTAALWRIAQKEQARLPSRSPWYGMEKPYRPVEVAS